MTRNRILVYALQSSGATAFMMLLGQVFGAKIFPDVWSAYPAPRHREPGHAAAKVVVTSRFSITEHKRRFSADQVILFLRNPLDNYLSLREKPYKNEWGNIREKMTILNSVLTSRFLYDMIVCYEDMIDRPGTVREQVSKLGWPLPPDAFEFPRAVLHSSGPQHDLNEGIVVGEGGFRRNFSGRTLQGADARIRSRVCELAPDLVKFYEKRALEETPK